MKNHIHGKLHLGFFYFKLKPAARQQCSRIPFSGGLHAEFSPLEIKFQIIDEILYKQSLESRDQE